MEQTGKQISFDLNTNSFEHILQELGLSGSEEIYAHLLRGEPLTVNHFAQLLQVKVDEAKNILAYFGEVDTQGQVVGFLGLSLIPTLHKMSVKGKTLYTWCAADTILLPQFLSISALIESKDPVNGQMVQLAVNENFLEWTDPVPLYISWVEKDDSCHIRHSFCRRTHFFASQQTAEKWLAENADAKISDVEEFFTFIQGGRRCC